MDLSIQLRTASGKICTLSLSFNNDGPLGTFFRYICDNGTYIARYDDLVTGKEEPIDVSHVDVSTNGIELQDREFVAASREGREPNSSVASVLSCYRVLGSSRRNWHRRLDPSLVDDAFLSQRLVTLAPRRGIQGRGVRRQLGTSSAVGRRFGQSLRTASRSTIRGRRAGTPCASQVDRRPRRDRAERATRPR